MSQDTQLMRSNGYPMAADDLWSQGMSLGAPGPAASPQQPQGSGMKKIHRLLRGRYLLAIILAAVGAAAGAAAGFFLPEPTYRSDGLIEIKPIVTPYTLRAEVTSAYTQYVQTQVQLLQSARVIQQAMESNEWRATGRGMSADATKEFMDGLDVSFVSGSQLIRVSYTDKDKKVAPIAVRAVITAYRQIYGGETSEDYRQRKDLLTANVERLKNKVRGNQDLIKSLSEKYYTPNLSTVHDEKLKHLVAAEVAWAEAKMRLDAAQAVPIGGEDAEGNEKVEDWTAERIASVDREMAGYVGQKTQYELNLQELSQTYGEQSRFVQQAKQRIVWIEKRIEARAESFRKQFANIGLAPDGAGGQLVVPESIEVLKRRAEYAEKYYKELLTATTDMGRARVQIQALEQENQQLTDQINEAQGKVDQLTIEQALSGQLRVIEAGREPVAPLTDKRKQLTAVGFVLGGAIPVAILMLIGLLDARYRYSDDAGSDMSGIPLLGILPNLPDLLTDPDQAAIAAHCVHQIRTMLQINAEANDHRAFALTSPSPGDGKTSLSLALGLSFAASGSRTLLIDCDLVGAGLTSRMNVKSGEGVLEAIASRSLLPFVQTTDVADMAILPVGAAQAHHSSLLSPSALRRLVAEARKHFDTILIDTGPILGSIEASPVCAAADSVILTVARGQQRPMVEKSLGHLMAIGARLAGVVFNRAQSHDFEQSVSRMSMRSLARTNGNGANGNGHGNGTGQPRLGPVAKAVATSVKPPEEN